MYGMIQEQYHSQMLRLASPVFDAMLGTDMIESQRKRVEVGVMLIISLYVGLCRLLLIYVASH